MNYKFISHKCNHIGGHKYRLFVNGIDTYICLATKEVDIVFEENTVNIHVKTHGKTYRIKLVKYEGLHINNDNKVGYKQMYKWISV
jgi:hypothetical protein